MITEELCDVNSQITDQDVWDYLHRTEDNTAKMILFMIELYRRKDDTQDVSHLEYRYTLEHIMPKKWEEFWSDVPIVNDGVTLAPDSEEGKRLRNQAIQQIGNKTLLSGTLNTKLRNSVFM